MPVLAPRAEDHRVTCQGAPAQPGQTTWDRGGVLIWSGALIGVGPTA